MANNIRIKVIFKRVRVLKDADWFGSGEFIFTARVAGRNVGTSQVFDAIEGQNIVLDEAVWSAVVDVTNLASVVVSFEGEDEDVFFNDNLGSVNYTLRAPWQQREFTHNTEYFSLTWGVEIEVEGSFGRHAPGEVYACRENNGSLDCTTVSGAVIPARMEIHPVRPVPPTASLPPRPALPSGTAELSVVNGALTAVTPTSDINVVPNPSVIPILTPAQANAQTAARIEFTYYRPNTLNFTDNDARLEWTAVAITAGAAVSFVGQPRGLKVFVYGTAAGMIRLEVRFRGALFATYRALVLPMKQVTCRFNILNGPTNTGPNASQPLATPANVKDHFDIANRYLRQMGLELVLDTNNTKTHNATDTTIPGIFRIRVSTGTTRNIVNAMGLRATRLNYRPGVMNFAYVHSEITGNILGAATDFPSSTIAPAVAGGRPTLTDSGNPSDSWALPSGVAPDAAAAPVTITLINAFQRPGFPQLFAMYVTGAGNDPSILANQQTYAQTICHELGHILNLGHRVERTVPVTAADPTGLAANGVYWDGLNHPPNENIMHWSLSGTIEQDFDILQTRAARRSPLVPGPADPV